MARITEKRLYKVLPQSFTANGTQNGVIEIANTRLFVVGHIVIIKSNTQPPIILKVKRIPDGTHLHVGEEKQAITQRTDVSAYLVADGAQIFAEEQLRPSIPEQEIERNTYAEEPTVARRVLLVDPLGDAYDDGNPLPVQVDTTVNIGDVRITAQDDDPNPGNQHSSVRISDGIDQLAVNPDGSINVVIPPGAGGIPVNDFNQIASVPANVLTDIITYTVPMPYSGTLFRVECGGNNVATYELYINGTLEGRLRTWFGTPLTQVMEFSSGASGFSLTTGDVINVKVIHTRPFVGDFEARIQIQLQ